MKFLTRNIWILSFVSLFNDVASEMLIPVLPIYLKNIGFSVVIIGLLEGLAEATAGLSKGYFGNLSDAKGKRLPFIQIGYAFSAVSKPMMGILTYPIWIFFARTLDRLGKGVRTAARDALLSSECSKETKGRVFGFHRSFDTVGAVLGPLLALIYLHHYPGQYAKFFILAFFPGIVAMLFTFLIREKKNDAPEIKKRPGFFEFITYWKSSSPEYKHLVTALLLFALMNSSDVFLLLKMKEAGFTDTMVIGVYIFYNVVYALLSYPLGWCADRWGMKKVFLLGLFCFGTVYGGMAFCHDTTMFFVLFFIYGIYAGATEGVAKAWITNICEHHKTATAIGTYTAFQSVAALLASSVAGFIWYAAGSQFVFVMSSIATFLIALYLFRVKKGANDLGI
jgi:MFS family permease